MRFNKFTNCMWPPLLGLILDCPVLTSAMSCWKLKARAPCRLARKPYAESLKEIWVGYCPSSEILAVPDFTFENKVIVEILKLSELMFFIVSGTMASAFFTDCDMTHSQYNNVINRCTDILVLTEHLLPHQRYQYIMFFNPLWRSFCSSFSTLSVVFLRKTIK